MTGEGQNIDRKSLELVTGGTVVWVESAKDCFAFAPGRFRYPRRCCGYLRERSTKQIRDLSINRMNPVFMFEQSPDRPDSLWLN